MKNSWGPGDWFPCRFYLRDADLGRRLLDAWIGNRCGFKDQYPLWHAILSEAGRAGCVAYAGEIYRMRAYDAMKRGAAAHPHLDVNATSLRATCGQFRYAPARFGFPAHRSVNPGDVAAFAYTAADGAGEKSLSVSNLLAGTPMETDLLAALGVDGLAGWSETWG